jgi:hypothetical protein
VWLIDTLSGGTITFFMLISDTSQIRRHGHFREPVRCDLQPYRAK